MYMGVGVMRAYNLKQRDLTPRIHCKDFLANVRDRDLKKRILS